MPVSKTSKPKKPLKKASKKSPAKKVAKEDVSAKTKVTAKKTATAKRALSKKKVARKKPAHADATIIRVGRGPVIEKAEPKTISIEPNKQTYKHKKNAVTGKKIGGISDFTEALPTPRLKIQPKSIDNLVNSTKNKMIEEHFTDTEDMSMQANKRSVEEANTLDISLKDPEPEDNEFAHILEDIEVEESSGTERNVVRKSTIAPGEESDTNFKNLVDDMEGVKSLDTKHYHVPISSRAVKSAGTYFLEFLVVLSLILIFVAILIDADLLETSFELPFDVL